MPPSARDKFGLTKEEYEEKPQLYKRLKKIWEERDIQAMHLHGKWSQTNTLLLDDDMDKAQENPCNLVLVPELTAASLKEEKEENKIPVLYQVMGYLDEAKHWDNVSAFVRQRPFHVGQGWERGGTEASPALIGDLRLDARSGRTIGQHSSGLSGVYTQGNGDLHLHGEQGCTVRVLPTTICPS